MNGNAIVQVTSLNDQGAEVVLTQEQSQVVELVQAGANVFFTGPAGTGKSVLLCEIIKNLKLSKRTECVAITASTGVAALNIHGRTLHSFAGIGLGKEPAEILLKKIAGLARKRWKNLEVLIIDEISMIDGALFDKLEWLARKVRKNERPFGGIQLVLSGDFFQLPPVPEKSHERIQPVVFAFDAKSWQNCIAKPIQLTQVFRQRESAFISLLSEMRQGRLREAHVQLLKSLSRPLIYNDGILPSELYPLRRQVEECNNCRLDALPGPCAHYQAMDFAGYDMYGTPLTIASAEKLLERLVALRVISLKVGALVMLIQNIEEELVNGTRGIVIDFLTVRDAQDQGIQIVESTGQRSKQEETPLPTAELRPVTRHVFSRDNRWPLVRFECGRILLCVPLQFTCEGPLGNVEASRTQVPLILSWAVSIHKSQGQTLERVKVDVGFSFEKGQVYVALSRAKSLDGLQIDNFEPSRVMAHPRVVEWHKTWLNVAGDNPQVVASSFDRDAGT